MNDLLKTEEAETSQVQAFWKTEACGTQFITDHKDEREFYEKFRAFRYETEWHLPLLVPFKDAAGKRVLEIGCGNGADGVMFAQHGAAYTGVDLTQTAVDATRKHFEVMGLQGSFQTENAQHLSFSGGGFDLVYSHGVLHHTPNPPEAFDEVHRVLKSGGQAVVMLYHKHSFNYYVRILGYMRLRLLLKMLSRIGRWESDRAAAKANTSVAGVRGNEDRSVWEIHYANFLRDGWQYLSADRFVHHCTDGPECPFAYCYSSKEAKQLFSKFKSVRTTVAHFPLRKYRWGKWIPLSVENWLAKRLGWYLFIYAAK